MLKAIVAIIFGFIVAFLFFNHSGESIYDPPFLLRLSVQTQFFVDDNTINQHYQK